MLEGIRQEQRQVVAEQQQLERLQRKRLEVKLGRRDVEMEEQDISNKATDITKRLKHVELSLEELDERFRDSFSIPGGTQVELSILRNVKMCVANELTNLSRNLRESRRRYMRTLDKLKAAQEKFAGEDKRKEIQARIDRDDAMDEYIKKGCTPEQIEAIMLNTRQVEERDQAVTKIVDSLRVLLEMQKDLHTMIVDQGTVLDRIDYNMTLTHDRVVQSKKELIKANDHLEAGSFKICVLLLVILIIGFTLALLVKLIA